MIHLFNRISEKENRKKLRKNSTEAESLLWKYLKNRGLHNLKIKRQYSVHKYVLDFYCPSCKLAIELDGKVHLNKDVIEHDEKRDYYLRALGIKILRIKNEEVLNNISEVLNKIYSATLP